MSMDSHQRRVLAAPGTLCIADENAGRPGPDRPIFYFGGAGLRPDLISAYSVRLGGETSAPRSPFFFFF